MEDKIDSFFFKRFLKSPDLDKSDLPNRELCRGKSVAVPTLRPVGRCLTEDLRLGYLRLSTVRRLARTASCIFFSSSLSLRTSPARFEAEGCSGWI